MLRWTDYWALLGSVVRHPHVCACPGMLLHASRQTITIFFGSAHITPRGRVTNYKEFSARSNGTGVIELSEMMQGAKSIYQC